MARGARSALDAIPDASADATPYNARATCGGSPPAECLRVAGIERSPFRLPRRMPLDPICRLQFWNFDDEACHYSPVLSYVTVTSMK
jgi:hypothetical protein